MKAYGLPRILDLQYPDAADLALYGLKSSAGSLPGKGGEFHGPRGKGRQAARRIWKKKERAKAKAALRNEIN